MTLEMHDEISSYKLVYLLNWLMTSVLEQLITMRLFLIEVAGELFIGVQYSLKLGQQSVLSFLQS